jgi:hypothetical protein
MLLLDADVSTYISENKHAITTNDYIEYKSYYTSEGEEFIDDDDEEDVEEEGVDVD